MESLDRRQFPDRRTADEAFLPEGKERRNYPERRGFEVKEIEVEEIDFDEWKNWSRPQGRPRASV
ncbi:MAG: hypothetical protein LBS70_04215 [Candidatus Accumulibacter sp.]|jgi:hypothetical protein|nr:hypothetical protein [Accumulibacter sp.]